MWPIARRLCRRAVFVILQLCANVTFSHLKWFSTISNDCFYICSCEKYFVSPIEGLVIVSKITILPVQLHKFYLVSDSGVIGFFFGIYKSLGGWSFCLYLSESFEVNSLCQCLHSSSLELQDRTTGCHKAWCLLWHTKDTLRYWQGGTSDCLLLVKCLICLVGSISCLIKLMCQVLPHNPWLMVVLLWWPVCFCSPFSFLSFLFWCSLPVVVSVSLMQVFWLNLIYLFYYRPMLSETFIGIYKHVQCIFCFSQNKICIFNHMTHPLSTVIQIIK